MNKKAKDEIPKVKRVFKGDDNIMVDTVKLETALFQKNVSFDSRMPIIEPVEHVHFFHSFDSNGKPQVSANSVLGHTHDVSLSVDKEGNIVGTCSAPRRNRNSEKILASDQHTHTIKYIKSEEIKLRKISSDAVKLHSEYMESFNQ